MAAPHPNPLPACGEREGPAKREGEGQRTRALHNGFDQLINAGFRRHALGDYRGDRVETKATLDPLADSLADEDLGPVFLVQPFEASCEIHAVAEHCIIHAILRAHIAHDRIAEMYAEANDERRQSLGFELTVERFARRLGRKGGATSSLHMI